MASVAELRRRLGPNLSDEEFLLRATMPTELVDAMDAAGPAPRHYNPAPPPVLSLLGELGSRPSVHDLVIAKPGLRLSVRRSSEGTSVA